MGMPRHVASVTAVIGAIASSMVGLAAMLGRAGRGGQAHRDDRAADEVAVVQPGVAEAAAMGRAASWIGRWTRALKAPMPTPIHHTAL